MNVTHTQPNFLTLQEVTTSALRELQFSAQLLAARYADYKAKLERAWAMEQAAIDTGDRDNITDAAAICEWLEDAALAAYNELGEVEAALKALMN